MKEMTSIIEASMLMNMAENENNFNEILIANQELVTYDPINTRASRRDKLGS